MNKRIIKVVIVLSFFFGGMALGEEEKKEDSHNNKWEISEEYNHVPYTKEEIGFATTEDEDEPVVSCGEYPEYCADSGDSGIEVKKED